MGFWDFLKPKSEVQLVIGGQRLGVKGSEAFVQQALAEFLRRCDAALQSTPRSQEKIPQTEPDRGIQRPVPEIVPILRERRAIRLHAMEGEVARVYAIDPASLRRAQAILGIEMQRIESIFVDRGVLSDKIKRHQKTLCHRLIPTGSEDPGIH